MNDFLPSEYELPVSENRFTKFEKDKTIRIRILPSGLKSNCMVFWEYFQTQTDWKVKPIRNVKKFQETPWIEKNREQKEVWAMKVYNYDTASIQICSISQKSLKQTIMWFINDNDYWNPLGFDLKISKTWEWLDTKYWIVPTPPKEFDISLIEWKDIKINWFKFLNSEKDIFSEEIEEASE